MRIKVPKSLRIHGLRIRVVPMAGPSDAWGWYLDGESTIYLRTERDGKPVDPAMVAATYIHELTHAALTRAGYPELSANETFVAGFAAALHQALTDCRGDFARNPGPAEAPPIGDDTDG